MSQPYHVVMEIENEHCRVLGYFESRGIRRFRVVDIRGLSGGAVRHLIEVPKEYADKVDNLRSATARKSASEDRVYVWFESEGCDVCNAILAHFSFLVSGRRVRGHTFLYSFVAPDFESYRSVVTALESRGFKVRIVRVKRFVPTGKLLTEKQEKVLWYALKTGFFDYPRRVNVVQLARALGIRPSTLSEIIRRGIKRLLEHYFEE